MQLDMKEETAAWELEVEVTYLEWNGNEAVPPAASLLEVAEAIDPDVAFYRFLYDTVGQPWLWWRRRAMDDATLRTLLHDPATRVYVFYRGGQPYGFFELDLSQADTVDIAYFGLMPFAIGRGYGRSALASAVGTAASFGRRITLNTCTADHPKALANYLAGGFRAIGTAKQAWRIPTSLGFGHPDRDASK